LVAKQIVKLCKAEDAIYAAKPIIPQACPGIVFTRRDTTSQLRQQNQAHFARFPEAGFAQLPRSKTIRPEFPQLSTAKCMSFLVPRVARHLARELPP
jgi:hypothetical protein